MKAKAVLFFTSLMLYLYSANPCWSQSIFFQDVFNGGVTGGGFSTGINSGGGGQIALNILPETTIRKAYLFCNRYGDALPLDVQLNDIVCEFNLSSQVGNDYLAPALGNNVRLCALHAVEITALVSSQQNLYDISFPIQSTPFLGNNFGAFYLLVLYEHPSLEKIAVSVIINETEAAPIVNYEINGLMPINTSTPVGLAIHSDILWNIDFDGSYIYVNDNSIGLIGGSDAVNAEWTGAGVKGHFYYENQTLFGLDDDTPDSLMAGTDGLADIKSYSNNNDVSLSLEMIKQLNAPFNIYLAYFLSYTTPCQAFEVTISENIEVCKGTQTQLQATGGNAYQWQPQIDLSCYNCPNPVFIGDTSRFYTCRIWNTDSCSKVLPVKVNVLPQPIVPAYTTTPTECYGNTGKIQITNPPAGFTYSLNNGTQQAQTLFSDLAEGYHLLTVTDSNGCKSDTSIYVAEVNSTVAQFSVSPQSGHIPLEVTLTNQSQHATNYVWYISNDTIQTTSTEPFMHTFNTEGSFDIALVAYHTSEECSDTIYKNVVSEFPFRVIVPTLYGGYMDGSPYRIYTSGLSSLQFKLYSNDGRLVRIIETTPAAGYINLWESTDLATGLYIFHIRAIAEDGTEKMITGKLVVV